MSAALAYPPIVNHLLELLSEQDKLILLQHCEVAELKFGTILCQPQQRYSDLYFPLSGFVSLVTKLTGYKPLEMGLIGNEGMLGVTLVLGIDTVPTQAIVQGKGSALRININDFKRLLKNNLSLQQVMQRYLFVLMAQLSRNSACLHFHELEPRLARWLLMSQDRAHSNSFHLTQQFLADMLGVRRSGVTVAAGNMQQKQLISYSRGTINILDRHGLEQEACECYQVGRKKYATILGELPVDSVARLLTEQGSP